MSNLYIANTGIAGQNGVWRVNDSDYQYIYAAFTPGEDVNLDLVSIRTQTTGFSTVSSKFQVGLYSAGSNSSTPGSLISYLSGPTTPTEGAYNDYSPTSTLGLSSGNQYWLGFTLSSNDGANNLTRVRLGTNTGNFTTLGAGWSAQSSIYKITNGSATNPAEPLIYSLYGTPRPVCFASGTLITMGDGTEKEIDSIRIADIVVTSRGPLPVKWVGHRTIFKITSSVERYAQSLPVRLEAGSLDKGLPNRDLLVSESHGLHVDHRITNACFLVNNINIYKDSSSKHPCWIRYFHLEFDEEVLILANGVEACSYVNTGNRRGFDNYPEFIARYINPASSCVRSLTTMPRNRISLRGHKQRIMNSWRNAESSHCDFAVGPRV
jgi:hypothetical protein